VQKYYRNLDFPHPRLSRILSRSRRAVLHEPERTTTNNNIARDRTKMVRKSDDMNCGLGMAVLKYIIIYNII
jgi:hypothetical protein